MSNEIESVKPAISVIIDDGDWIINSTGPFSKILSQAILPLAASASKVIITIDGETKVMKRNKAAENGQDKSPFTTYATARMNAALAAANTLADAGPDIQDSFVADLEAGITGEQAMGESSAPTPGPSEPVKIPTKRKPVIFQDAAAPPAPELVEAEMDRLMAEAQQAEQEAAKVAEQQRYQQQQAVQANVEVAAEPELEAAQPRRRTRERSLATTGRPCGRCGGAGQVVGDAGFQGACPVCHGEGQVKTWDRSLKVR